MVDDHVHVYPTMPLLVEVVPVESGTRAQRISRSGFQPRLETQEYCGRATDR